MKKTVYKYYDLSWQQVLKGYSLGIFPMGDDSGSIGWYEANPRAILPIENPHNKIHVTRSLSRVIRNNLFEVTIDRDFENVIKMCSKRKNTWINDIVSGAYIDLHKRGYAHSVEVLSGGKLAGGLYGVAYRGAFFGESMFHLVSNASKVAVVKLYDILKNNGFILFDIQMMTPHFRTFGAVEIPKRAYLEILEKAMSVRRRFSL